MASGKCPKQTNAPATEVSFSRIFAKQQAGGASGTCMDVFGSRKVTVDGMLCCDQYGDESSGMFRINNVFCPSYPNGETNITIAQSRWYHNSHNMCSGNPDNQYEDDAGLSGSSLDGSKGMCKGGSRKGLCTGGCTWSRN